MQVRGGDGMSYFDSQYSKVKQPMKCRKCGEVGLRFPHEKCPCHLKVAFRPVMRRVR